MAKRKKVAKGKKRTPIVENELLAAKKTKKKKAKKKKNPVIGNEL